MQVTETFSEGLKRELKVVIGAQELHERLQARLDEIKDKVHIKGFRPGKVPIEHIRKTYGRSVMAEVVQQAVSETTTKALQERKERPAVQPDIKLPEDAQAVEQVMAGKGDLEYVMSFEVLPKIDIKDLRSIRLERLVAEPEEDAIAASLLQLREANKSYEPKDAPGEKGDRLIIGFVGRIDGEPFEGGSAEDAYVVLGEGRFIPGFEEGVTGARAGETRIIDVTFPDDYGAAHLAGKAAQFEVTVKEVARPVVPEANDDFAKSLGLESFQALKDAVKARIAREYEAISRSNLKRALLDALDKQHSFELPPSLVESEFEGMWQELTEQLKRSGRSFEDEGTTEEKARAEYQSLAERRVRLGLILSEIGQKNDIKITDEDIKRAVIERARQYPGQENQVIEFYKKNQRALAELRAPVYEEKVVSFALELVSITDRSVSAADLMRSGDHDAHDHECGPDCDHDHDHSHAGDHDHGQADGKDKKAKKTKGK